MLDPNALYKSSFRAITMGEEVGTYNVFGDTVKDIRQNIPWEELSEDEKEWLRARS